MPQQKLTNYFLMLVFVRQSTTRDKGVHIVATESWLKVLALQCICGQFDGVEIGDFRFSRSSTQLMFDIEDEQGRTSRGILGYYTSNDFHDLKSCTYEKERYIVRTLTECNIEYADYTGDNVYPRFSFRWDKQDAEGKLAFMRIDLSPSTFVNYECLLTNAHRYARGDHSLYKHLPQNLDGLAEILGCSIPFTIHFQTESEKIIALSRLSEFAASVALHLHYA